MDLTDPASAVLPHGTRAILRVLAGTTQRLTGREVARLASLSQNGAHKVLARLVDHGLVHAEPAGRSVLYTLNREHLLSEGLLSLLAARRQLVDRLAAAVQAWLLPAVHVSVFGSAARGGASPRSDLDVLVVRSDDTDVDDPQWRLQLERVSQQVHDWTGNRLSWLEMSVKEITAAVSAEEPIVAEWCRDSRHLFGTPLMELLGVGSPATVPAGSSESM
jgi:predicted nucleotidyltransferase